MRWWMGVLFAGFLRAPMTSVFMVLEVSGNYSIILPGMIGNTIAYLISRALVPVPIFDLLSSQDGLELPSMEEQREVAILRVEDAMRSPNVAVVKPEDTLLEASIQAENAQSDLVFVHQGTQQWIPVTRDTIKKLMRAGNNGVAIGALLAPDHAPYFYADHPLHLALPFLYEYPVLPVVNRADKDRLEGVVSLQDALQAYRRVGQVGSARQFEAEDQ